MSETLGHASAQAATASILCPLLSHCQCRKKLRYVTHETYPQDLDAASPSAYGYHTSTAPAPWTSSQPTFNGRGTTIETVVCRVHCSNDAAVVTRSSDKEVRVHGPRIIRGQPGAFVQTVLASATLL